MGLSPWLSRAFAFALLFRCSPSFADPIVNALPVNPTSEQGGFWIGAFDTGAIGPVGSDGLNRFVVAQAFETHRTYSDIEGSVVLSAAGRLETVGNQPFVLSFVLAADNDGTPGTVLGQSDVMLTTPLRSAYNVAFPGVVLDDAATYWLVASSSLVAFGFGSPSCCFGTLPVWLLSDVFDGPSLAYSQNAGPWTSVERSFAFSMDGTVIGDPIANGDYRRASAPPPVSVPEPTSLGTLALGFVIFSARTIRRRMKRPGPKRSFLRCH